MLFITFTCYFLVDIYNFGKENINMAYQSNAMIKSIFRSKIWLIIYLILLFISYYNIGMNTSLQIKRVHMLRILGIIYDNDFLGTLSLFFLYQLFITLFMIHLYFIFENEHSAEYTLCRISRKKLIFFSHYFPFNSLYDYLSILF